MPYFDVVFFLFGNVKYVKVDLMVSVKMATISAKFVLENALSKTVLPTNYIKQHFLPDVMFNIFLVLISKLRSTINDILS